MNIDSNAFVASDETKYKLCWRDGITGITYSGLEGQSFEDALKSCEMMNRITPGLRHWVEAMQ